MVPKQCGLRGCLHPCFRAVLFRMVPKLSEPGQPPKQCFRAVLFRMVPKQHKFLMKQRKSFRAVLFRMVPKRWV